MKTASKNTGPTLFMAHSPVRAWYQARRICVELEGGRILRFPVKGNRRLESATPEQLGRIRLMPSGLHWPDVDEHLSIEGILRGDYGQQV
jgi:Protein of unknown function (DUF2442)